MSGDRRDDALVVGVIHLVIDATGAIVFGLLQTVSPRDQTLPNVVRQSFYRNQFTAQVAHLEWMS